MKTPIQISEAEATVMQVLWEKHPLAAEQVVEMLAGSQTWQMSTVKTLLNRLLKKGALAVDADGRRYLYRPLLTRRAYVASESRSLLDRLFDGKVAPLVSHFAAERKLTKRDVAELRRLLDELDHG
jgi:BlaI family transcriptional regulator, penicillinase repressor